MDMNPLMLLPLLSILSFIVALSRTRRIWLVHGAHTVLEELRKRLRIHAIFRSPLVFLVNNQTPDASAHELQLFAS
jgi:hypothetical protein